MARATHLVILGTLTSCDAVYGLEGRTPDSATTTDGGSVLCAPLPYDARRYTPLVGAGQLTWTAARTQCKLRGFDLAVLDEGDSDELTYQTAGAALPFWLGVEHTGDWTGVDGCVPSTRWAPGEPVVAATGRCVVMTGMGLASEPCDATTHAGVGLDALCETPRPSAACQAITGVLRSTYLVASTALVGRAVARDMCTAIGMHLVELSSGAELGELAAMFSVTVPRFWVAASFVGDAWISATGCPQIFPWQLDEPRLPDRACAFFDGGLETGYCDGNADLASAICERND